MLARRIIRYATNHFVSRASSQALLRTHRLLSLVLIAWLERICIELSGLAPFWPGFVGLLRFHPFFYFYNSKSCTPPPQLPDFNSNCVAYQENSDTRRGKSRIVYGGLLGHFSKKRFLPDKSFLPY
jgi:hypothetical protein